MGYNSNGSPLDHILPSPNPTGEPSGQDGLIVTEPLMPQTHSDLIRLQQAVTLSLSQSSSPDEALHRVLSALGDSLSWPVGVAWRVDRETRALVCQQIWLANGIAAPAFTAATQDLRLQHGAGLPGRVWANGQAAWITDVQANPWFLRLVAAAAASLHTVLAVPILAGPEVIGILEFYRQEVTPPDPDLLTVMTLLAMQLGSYLQQAETADALRTQAATNAAMLAAALDCFIAVDHRGLISEFNPAAEQTFGYRRDEAIGRPAVALLVPPALRATYDQQLSHFVTTGESDFLGRRIEITAIRQDGREFPVELSITRPNLPGPPQLIIFLRDLSESRRIAAALQQSETRYRRLFEESPFSTQIFGPDGQSLEVNAAWERFWQCPREEIATFNLLDDPQTAEIGLLSQVLPAFAGETVETSLVCYDPAKIGRTGRERWVRGRLFALKDAVGAVQQVVFFHDDQTEQVQAEAAQLAQQQWLEGILDLMPTPLILVSPDSGEVIFANQAADRLAGGRVPKILAGNTTDTPYMCTDADGRPLTKAELPGIRAGHGESISGFHMDWHGPMGRRSLLVHAERLPAMYDQPEMVVMALLDVGDLKKVEADLREAVQSRDTFLSIASHELKTPLTSLLLHIESLRRRAGEATLPPPIGDKLQTIERQAGRLSILVNELLDVSRLTAGRLDLEAETLDLVQVVQEVSERFSEQLERCGSALQVTADPAVVGCWDRSRCDQVVTNLLSNAIKFGEGQPIDLGIVREGEKAVLTVRDRGIGIDPADCERLFQRFERLVSARHFGGFGLGLWIVRQIIMAMGGTIHVDSMPGQGTTFRVELPVSCGS
jgi:PAS domain S-box-containing protein